MNDLYYDMDTINIDIKWLVDGWSIAKVRSLIQEKPEVLFVAHLAQDNRDIPPMMAICTMVQDTYVPVCRGFCALLVHWAIGDAFNRKVAVNADSFTLEFEDFNFDFEEFREKMMIDLKAIQDKMDSHPELFTTDNGFGKQKEKSMLDTLYEEGIIPTYSFPKNVVSTYIADSEGKSRMKRWLPLGMTADERMCSGAHYAAFFASMVKHMDNPELLETPPESVKFDFGGKYEYHVPKVKKAE